MKAVLLILIILHPLLFLQGYMAGNWYSILHDYSLGMVFGVFAYCYMVAALLMATRFRFLDRVFGQDRVIRIHSHLASVAILFGCIHMVLKQSYIAEATTQIVLGQAGLGLGLTIASITVVFMVGRFVVPLPGISALYRFGKRFSILDYDRLKKLHNLFVLVLLFLIVHVNLATSTQENTLRVVAMGVWGIIGVTRYGYFIIRRKIGQKRFKLTSVTSLSDTTVEVTLNPEKAPLHFLPGQFGYLRIQSGEIKNREHPFTISSTPSESELRFTVKELGDFTRSLKAVESGAIAVVDGSYGKFTPVLSQSPYLFVAAGIGITPFLSILKSWNDSEVQMPVTLVWSVTRESELIEIEFLKELAETAPWFELKIFVTRNPETSFTHGRLTEGEHLQAYSDREIYLCGPAPFMKSAKSKLKEFGAKRAQFHSESFSS